MARAGKDFEKAVEAFCRHLDPNADCQFDIRVPDRDTGTLRQVDGWIKLRVLGGHVPINMLVSCKDQSRPIDIHGVEECSAEMRSTGASNAILYSSSGFTEPAITKGRALNIACCKLLVNQSPEMPSELFVHVVAAYPNYSLMAQPIGDCDKHLRWHRFLRFPLYETVAVRLTGAEFVTYSMAQMYGRATASNSGHQAHIEQVEYLHVRFEGLPHFDVHAVLHWEWYQCRLNAYRMSGSINVTDGGFVGSTTFPLLPLDSAPPSTQWERCEPPPAVVDAVRFTMTGIYFPLPEHLLQATRSRRLFAGPPITIAPNQVPGIEHLLLHTTREGAIPLFPTGLQMTTSFSISPKR